MSSNHLSDCTSPYLQQHADNPVEWYPWCEEALQRAKRENKPILLSIGYSACHWCHVMAHESFEDEATAEVMNHHFINIKVDREERPDLDKVYQQAHQLLTQRPGGWPLTVFLTPDDQAPFFAGTYFPKEPKYGMLPFVSMLEQIASAYTEQPTEIAGQNQALLRALRQIDPTGPSRKLQLDPIPLESARQQLARAFDETHGGFGEAPKFPHCTDLERLLRHWLSTDQSDARALHMVNHTLDCMAQGGVNDQVGGGFFRYSVDGEWMIPHFEKMLYDNGPLLALYTDLWQITEDPSHRRTATSIADWVLREMQSAEGGFYSTLDADSKGEEGLYYTWSSEELRSKLSEAEYQALSAYYQLEGEPNFEGRWHLHHNPKNTQPAEEELLDQARKSLFKARDAHPYPGRDDKILTAWNALMIKGLARCGRMFNEQRYINAADKALHFIHQHLWQNNRLLASHIRGESNILGYLDDYAFLLDAVLEQLQARWDNQHLVFAQQLAEVLLDQFEDQEHGGFFFTSHEHETLIYRPKSFEDGSTPSGNGTAAVALNRLGHLLAEPRYLKAAERTLHCALEQLHQMPHGYCTLLIALEEQLYPPETIIIRGPEDGIDAWQLAATRYYSPKRITLAIPETESDLSGLLAQPATRGEIQVSVCQGTHCLAQISEIEQFREVLKQTQAKPLRDLDQAFDGPVGSFKRHRE